MTFYEFRVRTAPRTELSEITDRVLVDQTLMDIDLLSPVTAITAIVLIYGLGHTKECLQNYMKDSASPSWMTMREGLWFSYIT